MTKALVVKLWKDSLYLTTFNQNHSKDLIVFSIPLKISFQNNIILVFAKLSYFYLNNHRTIEESGKSIFWIIIRLFVVLAFYSAGNACYLIDSKGNIKNVMMAQFLLERRV